MLLVVGGIKGGSGKTTLATNLTVLRAQAGRKVLLVDADEQQSSHDWAEQRDEKLPAQWVTISLIGKSIHQQLKMMRSDYDDIIVDTGGRDTSSQRAALIVADNFLAPFRPRSIDIWTLGALKNMVSEVQQINPSFKAYIVLNQADNRGSDNEDAKAVIKNYSEFTCLDVTIGNRKAFANAAGFGKGISEIHPSDEKAETEMQLLHASLYQNDTKLTSN